MKVLADYHHDGLYQSLRLLFEKRLGWELYRPIGLEWYTQGYWHVFPHINTARQFLDIEEDPILLRDVHGELLAEMERKNLHLAAVDDGLYMVKDPVHGSYHRAITLERFRAEQFDILVSSIPQHIEPFNKLIRECQRKAKHIFQVGNCWGHQRGVRNIMVSTAPFPVPAGTNIVFYHQ